MERVAICISGVLREFKGCWDSILNNIVRQFETDIFLRCWLPVEETKLYYGHEERGIIKPDSCTMEEAIAIIQKDARLIAVNAELFDVEKKSVFDLYEKPYTSYKHKEVGAGLLKISTVNTLAMAYNISECNEMQKKHSKLIGKEYDFVFRIRPDLMFHSPLELKIFTDVQESDKIGIPEKDNHTGTNDQVAWGRPEAMNKYADWYYNIQKVYDAGCYFHPESLLRDHIRSVGLTEVHVDVNYDIKRP